MGIVRTDDVSNLILNDNTYFCMCCAINQAVVLLSGAIIILHVGRQKEIMLLESERIEYFNVVMNVPFNLNSKYEVSDFYDFITHEVL